MIKTYEDFYVPIERIVLAHKFEIPPYGTCDYTRGRKMFGLVYPIAGAAEYHMASGEVCTLHAGEVAFVPANSAYYVSTREQYTHYTVNFLLDTEKCRGGAVIHELLSSDRLTVLSPQNRAVYENLFATVCTAWHNKQLGYEMVAVGHTYALLCEFISEKMIFGIAAASYRRVLLAKEYLDKNYNRTVTIAELADLCGMSDTNFRRIFGSVFGETPFVYRDKVRVLHACDYLAGNTCSIAEVAEKCGFSDANYFSRFFKKHTGVSPGAYKRL